VGVPGEGGIEPAAHRGRTGTEAAARQHEDHTQEQVDNLSSPPDWYPDEHAPAPRIVSDGSANKGFACGSCHLMSGYGHPESSDLVGLPAAYIVQQMADFKSGARKEPIRMTAIAQATSDEDVREAAEWFANLKPSATPWVRTVEAPTVPRTYLGPGRMRFAHPEGATEPIGSRIIMLPENVARARLRDPRSGFIAYVPPGSIARGKALVETGDGGKTVACAICHGDGLHGLGNVPRIAGHHPIYTVRQLHLFKDGSRNGPDAALMKRSVEKLSDDDILAISAYLGSLP
jgi:cytochrome c553